MPLKSMPRPVVSVIVPTYNRAYILWRALSSIVNQTYRNFELIVVDDGSKDCTARLVEEFQDLRVRYFFRPNGPHGAAAARNFGTEAARGEFIAHLDSDNSWSRRHLSSLIEVADAQPQDVMFYTGQVTTLWERGHSHRWTKIARRRLPRTQYTLDDVRDLRWPDVSCMLYRKTLVQHIGGFDEALSWLDDWDFFFRAIRSFETGCRWVPGTGVEYRQIHGVGADGICAEAREDGVKEYQARRALLAKWGDAVSDSARARLGVPLESIQPLRAGSKMAVRQSESSRY